MDTDELRLSNAELAVIFQHLWNQRDEPNPSLLEDLRLDQAALAEGRRSLIERELLLVPPRRSETVLSPALEPVLAAVTRPTVLGVLQAGGSGATGETTYYSWTPERTVMNRVTESGEHLLRSLPGIAAIGKDIAQHPSLGDTTVPDANAAADPEAVVQRATRRGVFMAVVGVQTDAPDSHAISWIVSGGELWLVLPEEGVATPHLTPARAADVARTVQSLMETAVERAQAGLSNSANGRQDGRGRRRSGGSRSRS